MNKYFQIALISGLALTVGQVTVAQTRSAINFTAIPEEPVIKHVQVPPLVGPNDLAKLMEVSKPYIIDIRHESARQTLYSYKSGHIPSSVNLPYSNFRKLWDDPLSVPTDSELTDLIQRAGIKQGAPIVLVHSSAASANFGSVAFAYWTLKSAGIENITILNGGIRGWQDAGLPLSKEMTTIARSDTVVTMTDKWLATHEDVDAVLDGTSDAQLLDARPLEQIKERASLDGSFKLHAGELVAGQNGMAQDDNSIFQRIKQADLDWQFQDVITYCNNGALAAIDWFMASEVAEIPNVRMYAHSLNARQKAQSLWNKVTN